MVANWWFYSEANCVCAVDGREVEMFWSSGAQKVKIIFVFWVLHIELFTLMDFGFA